MIREWKEKWSFVGEPKRRAVVTVPVQGKATEIDITDEMRAACESIVPPISETMMDLLARVEPEYQERVRNNVILAGGSALIPGLADGARPSARRNSAAAGRRWSTIPSSPGPTAALRSPVTRPAATGRSCRSDRV